MAISFLIFFYILCFYYRQRDYYHTCYALSGLAAAQYSSKGTPSVLGIPNRNAVGSINPLYNLTVETAEKAQNYFDNLPRESLKRDDLESTPSSTSPVVLS